MAERGRPDRRGLIGLLVAVAVSGLGTQMTFLALPWYVLTTTGSATQTGLVAFAEMTPYVLVQGVGGPLVDRWGARRCSVVCDLGSAIAFGLLPVLQAEQALTLPVLSLLVAVAGALRGCGRAARSVLVPGVGERAAAAIERSAGLYDGVNRLAALSGAPLAGALVAVISPISVLGIDAATFAASALLVAALVPAGAQPPAPTATGGQPGYLAQLAEGFRFLSADRLLLGIAAMLFVTNLIDQAGGAVLVPVWAHQIAHSSVALGLIGGAFSAGAVVGNLVATWLGPRLPRRMTYAVGYLILGGPRYLTLALAATVSPVLLVSVFSGLGAGGINPIIGAVEYERIPRHLQARVLGALGATAWAGIPVGSLLGGAAAATMGIRGALLAAAAAYGATTLAPFLFPAWRAMDERPALILPDRAAA